MVSVSGGVPLSERLPLEFRSRSIRFRLPGWGAGVPPLAAVHHVPTTGVATAHPFAESEEFWSRRRGRGGGGVEGHGIVGVYRQEWPQH